MATLAGSLTPSISTLRPGWGGRQGSIRCSFHRILLDRLEAALGATGNLQIGVLEGLLEERHRWGSQRCQVGAGLFPNLEGIVPQLPDQGQQPVLVRAVAGQ